MEIKITGAVVQ